MSDTTLARRVGRRMDRLFVDRGLFAWTHRILGVIAGSTCVASAIAFNRFLFFRDKTLWFWDWAGGACALTFFAAAFPFVVSYSSNIDLVDEKFSRTALFAVGLVGTSLLVDAWTVWLLRSDSSALALGVIYVGQAIAYVGLGHLALGQRSDGDNS